MLDKVEINVDNFALINSGSFELNKITVIKGGDFKSISDLNRILFAGLISLSSEGDYAASVLFRTSMKKSLGDESDLPLTFMMKYNKYIHDWDPYNVSYDYLSKKLKALKKIVPKRMAADLTEVEEFLTLFDGDKRYRDAVFNEMLNREFRGNKLDEYDDYGIKLTIDGEYETFLKCENKNRELGVSYELDRLPGNIVYLDSIPIFDLGPDLDEYYHYEELFGSMNETHIECKGDTFDIEETIENAINGGFAFFDGFYFVYRDGKEAETYEVDIGTRHLGTLDLLLEGLGLPEKSVLMINNIDEEMDGEYIKVTAEVISKLALELDLLVLINTQRDDFVEALKKAYDGLLVYNAVQDDNGRYDFELDEA